MGLLIMILSSLSVHLPSAKRYNIGFPSPPSCCGGREVPCHLDSKASLGDANPSFQAQVTWSSKEIQSAACAEGRASRSWAVDRRGWGVELQNQIHILYVHWSRIGGFGV